MERRLREPVSAEKCSLRVELPGETVEPESCVRAAGVSSGEDRVGLVLKQASDACGEYRAPAEVLVSPTCQDPEKHTYHTLHFH